MHDSIGAISIRKSISTGSLIAIHKPDDPQISLKKNSEKFIQVT
jgi:hypothetical protein